LKKKKYLKKCNFLIFFHNSQLLKYQLTVWRHKTFFRTFANVATFEIQRFKISASWFSSTCRYSTFHVPCGISIQTSHEGLPPGRVGCAHARSALSIMNLFKPKEDWGSPTNHITGFWTNEMAESSVQQPIRIGWLQLRPRPNNIYSERIAIGILGFLTDHDDFDLWEMLQRIYREEQPNQASKDPRRFFTDLFLWGMRQRVQSSWPQKEAWNGP
jgi:hypothetical protein